MTRRLHAIACAGALACAMAAMPAGAATQRTSAQAHAAATAAYKAYDARDYTAAVAQAQQAVRLAPARRDYWALLAQSLIAAGRLAEAAAALERGQAATSGDAKPLAAARDALQRTQAQAAGAAMYRDLEAGRIDAAIAQARAAVQFAPEHAGYRIALVHALLRADQASPAEQAASEALALLPDSAVPLALRAYARYRLGRTADAQADMDRALQQRGLAAADARHLRLLAADMALAGQDGARAQQVLAGLPATDTEVQARLQRARAARPGAAAGPRVGLPALDCSQVDAAQTCVVRAAAQPAEPGFDAAAAAYRALEERDPARALPLARTAAAASPGRRDWQLLHMQAAQAAGQHAEAEQAASAALALQPGDATLLAQRAALRRQLGQHEAAKADATQALAIGGLPPAVEATLLADTGRHQEARARLAAAQASGTLSPQAQLDLAYAAVRVGDDRTAHAAFAQADAAGALPVTLLLDAGYTAMRAKQDAPAIGYLRRAIDAAESLALKLEPRMAYDTRRQIADISRRWGVIASVTARRGGGAIAGFGPSGGGGGQYVVQGGAEVYWRPWGYRNGQYVELFARGFQTLHSQAGGLTGGDSFEGAIGARWKPLTDHNAVLSISRVFGANVRGDWLAQAAYSLDHGTDLRVDTDRWNTMRLSAEVGYYFERGQTYGLAQAQAGRSFRLGGEGRTVAFPHGVVAAEYDSARVEKTSVGAGPGISLRHWFREDKYHAPRSYFDVTLQYRARLAGDGRAGGLFLNSVLSY